MTNSQKMQEVTGVDNLLEEAGLQDLVKVTVEVMMNDRGKKTPHVVARYWETVRKVNKNKDGYIFVDEVTEKIEELNKYFSSGIFAMGITQRADWLKATSEDRIEYLKQPGFHHPAHFIPKKVEVKRPQKTNKYKNGYQGKVDFYLDRLADSMGDKSKYEFYTKKLNYFLGRQDEWLKTQNC
tara:strand:+ start:45 stop:590 length:546 start_codon:yes stop_codon:yes gene_type:complete